MARRVALVSDSTSVDASLAAKLDVTVVPLQVTIGTRSYDETSPDVSPALVAKALQDHKPVSTSRPAPERFVEVYRDAEADGAEAVLSIHLSGEVSGTVESALLAAREVDVPVEVVDSRLLGVATAFTVAAAAEALDAGAEVAAAAEVARACAAATRGLLYVDTLEYLRRGGRIGMAASLLGSALMVKPLLQIQDGRIVPLDKVRTASRALARLEELVAEDAGERSVHVAVSHLANPERASALAERLAERVHVVGDIALTEVGAVIGAHVGPGMVAVAVCPVDAMT